MDERFTDRFTDETLSELPIDLLLSNIKDQVDTPQSTVNYFDPILEKLEQIKSEYMEDTEKREEYETLKNDLAHEIIDIITNAYEITVDEENIYGDEAMELAEALYIFFVVDYQEVIQRFFYRYIRQNKASLAAGFKDDSDKKDVTTVSTKKKIKDKDLATIVINLSEVVNQIIEMDTDEDEFIVLGGEDDSLYKDILLAYVRSGRMFGNFADSMIDKLNDDFLFIKESIIVYVQSKLMHKLNK